MKRGMWLLVTILLFFSGCGQQAELCRWGERSVRLPENSEEVLLVMQGDGSEYGILLELYDRASLNRAKADGVEKAVEEGMGWICSLAQYDEAAYAEMTESEIPGFSVLGRDEAYWYVMIQPTDVRMYAGDNEIYDEDELELWGEAQKMADVIIRDFVSRNRLRKNE